MSMGDADAKFPGQHGSGLPPSPSRENPGQVYPQSDPKAAPAETIPGTGGERQPATSGVLGNPYVLEESFSRLDHALTDVISKFQREERSVGAAPNEDALLRKFSNWRDELTQIRHGQRGVAGRESNADAARKQEEGGLFTD
ncbi:hypothetical protein L226DRAFT_533155 [Lentinus tigrinus ALCF2SS1-7]|uniref:uncharacterized protein n=1 Tax=Lentinus tigrinus ALCF2SS1-7 TaxID=1328758 RepID=UPI001165FA4D|nr:hypothetical protein L226DRAFT_533155 [Lentinus tigrinus ALCF2SS1-7]